MTFDQWYTESLKAGLFKRSEWVKHKPLSLYVRCSTITPGLVELANMTSTQKGKGGLTKFLDKYEPDVMFLVENIQNLRLAKYFLKRDYRLFCGERLMPTMIDFALSPHAAADVEIFTRHTRRNGGYREITNMDDFIDAAPVWES